MRGRVKECQDAEAKLHYTEDRYQRQDGQKPKVESARGPANRLDPEHDEGSPGREGQRLQECAACRLRNQERTNIGRRSRIGRADNDAQGGQVQPEERASNLGDGFRQSTVERWVRSAPVKPITSGRETNRCEVLSYRYCRDNENSSGRRPCYRGPDPQ